jgi:hypothetical protein
MSTGQPVEVPPWNAIDHGDDHGFRPQQFLQIGQQIANLMGLDSQKDSVLWASICHALNSAHTGRVLLTTILKNQSKPIFLNGSEVLVPCNERYRFTRVGQFGSQIAPDSPSAHDGNFHV